MLLAFLITSAFGLHGARAQGPLAIPDPASVTVPDITASERDIAANGHRFFIFHSSSVTYEQAFADIAECRSFLPAGQGRLLPSFTAWPTPPPAPRIEGSNAYGVVGALMAAIIMPRLLRGQSNNVLRRCMETRGYARFAVSEAAWEALNEGNERMIVAMQARLASGPRPTQPEASE